MTTIPFSGQTVQALSTCPLCTGDAGRVVWQSAAWCVVHADSAAEEQFPAFYRLICHAHYVEWSDLPAPLQQEGMAILTCIETLMRQHFRPFKMNLASLGNVVPHVHWHIIARYAWDSHFPAPVWAAPQRDANAAQVATLRAQLPTFEAALREALRPWADVA